MDDLFYRSATWVPKVDGMHVSGYAVVWGDKAMVKRTTECFRAGAFDEVINSDSEILAFVEHDSAKPLGRRSVGTLKIGSDDRGLHYAIDLPDTSYGRDVAELVRRGDIQGASVGFAPGRYETTSRGIQHTAVARLAEISLTATPYYKGSTAVIRSESVVDPRSMLYTQIAISKIRKMHG